MGRGAWVWWALPAVVSAVVAGTMYHLASEAERGSRAGAEPVVAGILVALPFVALSLLEALCALRAVSAGSRPVRTRSLWAASTVAGLVVVLVLVDFVGRARQGYLSVGAAAQVACLVAVLLVPLVPVWLVHAKEPVAPS